jgi:hypothetical protein
MVPSFRLGVFALAAAALAAAGPAPAQRVDTRRIIDFHVNREGRNVSFDGSVLEGGRWRLTLIGGPTYALSMVQLDAARKLYAVTVFRGEGPGDTTTYRALETVRATANVPAPLTSVPDLTVVIQGTRTAQASAGAMPLFNLAAYTRRMTRAFDDYCCVVCGEAWACGCAVSSSCGNCCVQPCCSKMPAPPPGGGMAQYFPDRAIQSAGRRCKEVPVNERLYPALHATERIASR